LSVAFASVALSALSCSAADADFDASDGDFSADFAADFTTTGEAIAVGDEVQSLIPDTGASRCGEYA
jgi:hypothetical protein